MSLLMLVQISNFQIQGGQGKTWQQHAAILLQDQLVGRLSIEPMANFGQLGGTQKFVLRGLLYFDFLFHYKFIYKLC
jgi:hypothetical protein